MVFFCFIFFCELVVNQQLSEDEGGRFEERERRRLSSRVGECMELKECSSIAKH